MEANRKNVLTGLSVFALILSAVFFGLYTYEVNNAPVIDTQQPPTTTGGGIDNNLLMDYVNSLPKQDLSQDEIDAILYMREEEKLARDVYLSMYDLYGSIIFSNIANSEQTHMDAVKLLIDKYNLTDPVGNDTRGVFQNQDLQQLYNVLIANGSKSLTDALTVGGIIEEVDIIDLDNWKTKVDNEDILYVFDLLISGSENHLRAFTNQLKNLGVTYEPHYLTQEQYDEIISSTMNRGSQYTMSSTTTTSYQTASNYLIVGIIFAILGIIGLVIARTTEETILKQ